MLLTITVWPNFTTSQPTRLQVEWPTFFEEVHVGPNKKALPGWSPALYPEGATNKVQVGCGPITALVLDYDNVELEHIQKTWEGFEYVIHSTHSLGSDDKPLGAYRILMPYAPGKAPRTLQEHAQVWQWAKDTDPRIDGSCKDVGRLYGLPARRPDGPPSVYLYQQGEFFDPSGLITETLAVAEPTPLERLLRQVYNAAQEPTANLTNIESQCNFMAHCREDAGTLSEPEWYAWLSVLVRCVDGEQAAHEVGVQHKGYSYADTEAKLQRAKNTGPRTCANISTLHEGCATCPHTITSPILLGRTATAPHTTEPYGIGGSQVAGVVVAGSPETPSPGSSPVQNMAQPGTPMSVTMHPSVQKTEENCVLGNLVSSASEEKALSMKGVVLPQEKEPIVECTPGNTAQPIATTTPLAFPAWTPKTTGQEQANLHNHIQGLAAQEKLLAQARTALLKEQAQLKAKLKGLKSFAPVSEQEEVQQELLVNEQTLKELADKEKDHKQKVKQAEAMADTFSKNEDVPPNADPTAWMLLNKVKGQPTATPANVHTILATDPFYKGVFWLDVFAQQPWFGKRKMSESIDVRVQTDLERRYNAVFHLETLRGGVLVVSEEHQRHPVQEYLRSLQWDKQPRIMDLLTKGFGATADHNSTFLGMIAEKFLVSMVARAFEPGCKADNMLVLTGPQRKGKSTALRALVSPPAAKEVGGWFTDAGFDPENKDGQLLLQGNWLVEVGELDSFKGKRETLLKSFLSRQVDRFRPPYGRYVQDFPRGCVLAGTTNEDEFLGDSTGSLRYYAVRVERCDVKWIERHRDQLWAEAVAYYQDGRKWWLESDEEYEALARNNRSFELAHPWADIIPRYCQRQKKAQVTTTMVLTECLGKSADNLSRYDKAQVTSVLRALGFGPPGRDRERGLNGEYGYWWTTPAEFLVAPTKNSLTGLDRCEA